jgi:hypothetical protein
MPAVDLTGQRFGRLVALARVANARSGGTVWRCICDCRVQKDVATCNLRRGRAKSCGCRATEAVIKHGATRGNKPSPEYRAWTELLHRCSAPGAQAWKNYGGRGITVSDRWRYGEDGIHPFECFRADMGPKPSPKHSLDRIDNDLGYSKENCRWATPTQQARNTRTTKLTAEKARQIHIFRLSGCPLREIARLFKVSEANAYAVLTGRSWRDCAADA